MEQGACTSGNDWGTVVREGAPPGTVPVMQKPNRGSMKVLILARLQGWAEHLRSGSPGQGMVEYALILMLVAMVLIVIVGVLGGHVTDMYSNISNGVAQASS